MKKLFCGLGHVVLREGKLVCGGSGHGKSDRQIDLEELVARAIAADQLDLGGVMRRLKVSAADSSDTQTLFTRRTARHKAKLVFDLAESDGGNVLERVEGAGIGLDGRVWIVSRSRVRAEQRLRIEGVHRNVRQFFGPFEEVGNMLFADDVFAFMFLCDTDAEVHMRVYREEGGDHVLLQDGGCGDLRREDLDRHDVPLCHMCGDRFWGLSHRAVVDDEVRHRLRYVLNDVINDLWQYHDDQECACSERMRDRWYVMRNHDSEQIGIGFGVAKPHDRIVLGPKWDFIRAARVVDTDKGTQLVYVAQHSAKIYKVTVPLEADKPEAVIP